jgi:hypothetical protein
LSDIFILESNVSDAIALLPVSDEAIAAMKIAQNDKWMKASRYDNSTGVYTYQKTLSQDVINQMIVLHNFSFAYIEKDQNGKNRIYNYFEKKEGSKVGG